jgi:hypothetical protein
MALSQAGTEDGGVMRSHHEAVTPEMRPILHGALLAITALALSFIATALALEPHATDQKAHPVLSGIRR